MPQLDKFTFISQVFWLLLTLTGLYFFLLYFILPRVGKVLKFRNYEILKLEQGLKNFKDEHTNMSSSFDASCVKLTKLSVDNLVNFTQLASKEESSIQTLTQNTFLSVKEKCCDHFSTIFLRNSFILKE